MATPIPQNRAPFTVEEIAAATGGTGRRRRRRRDRRRRPPTRARSRPGAAVRRAPGERFDGHALLPSGVAAGARAVDRRARASAASVGRARSSGRDT